MSLVEVAEERERAARKQAEREAKEREDKALANYQGPRWWEQPSKPLLRVRLGPNGSRAAMSG
jgi:hypothetical protein